MMSSYINSKRLFGLGAAVLAVSGFFFISQPAAWMPSAAWMCSLLSLGWSSISLLLPESSSSRDKFRILHPHASWIFNHLALHLGVVAAIVLSILLTMRCVYVGIEVIHGYPWQGARYYGFGATGLWTLLILNMACAVGFVGTRESRFLTVQFWANLMAAMWACLLSNPFQPTRTGGFERTDATLILTECVASITLIWVVVMGWRSDGKKQRRTHVLDTVAPQDEEIPPGFRRSVALVAMVLNIAVLYHILVPAGQSSSILRVSGFRAGMAAATAMLGCICLLKRSWGANLADATLGLFSLTICGLATLAVPAGTMSLDQRFPMIFNVMLVGYASAAAILAHLAGSWSHGQRAESTRAKMVPHLKRFAFFSAATALLAGVMMCFWPGLPGIAAMDHSLSRVLAGFAGFLFLLLVSLRSSRLMGQLSFRYLTVAAAACMVAFLLMRATPFSSDLHH